MVSFETPERRHAKSCAIPPKALHVGLAIRGPWRLPASLTGGGSRQHHSDEDESEHSMRHLASLRWVRTHVTVARHCSNSNRTLLLLIPVRVALIFQQLNLRVQAPINWHAHLPRPREHLGIFNGDFIVNVVRSGWGVALNHM